MLRRGPTPGVNRQEPLFPERVAEIVRLRDSGMTFAAIAVKVGKTRMNCCSQYNRWRDWGRAQNVVVTAAE